MFEDTKGVIKSCKSEKNKILQFVQGEEIDDFTRYK
jgi:hypothetical protein